MLNRRAHCVARLRSVLAGCLAALMLIAPGGASCTRVEVQEPADGARLRDLNFGPGAQASVNSMPAPVSPDAERFKPIPLTVPSPARPAGTHGAPLDPQQRDEQEAAAWLHRPVELGVLICRARDPHTGRPLQVLIRVVGEHRVLEAVTDPVQGQARFEMATGRVKLYCTAGDFFTPYTNQIDLREGNNTVDVLLTQVPDLTPARYGFCTLTLARSAQPDRLANTRRSELGQPDFSFVLNTARPAPSTSAAPPALSPPVPADAPTAVDGPYGLIGSRFAGLGLGPPPQLASAPAAAPDPDAARIFSCAPMWDDLHRLQQAGFLRLWLYPAGRATQPQLAHALDLPARQYCGSEGWLAAERGPGLELVTLGPRGEGEAEYFELLNRGRAVTAIAEPADLDPTPPATAAASQPTAASAGATYQSLPADLYTAVVSAHTLVRIGQTTALAKKPAAADMLAWLKAGQVQVAYGPVLDWRIREFTDQVGYPTQPIPAADRLYHLDLSAFVGPGAPPEFRSIQRIELLRNGVVVARLPVDRPLESVRDLSFEIHESADCWYMLRAYSGAPSENRADLGPVAAHWRRSWSAPIHFAALARAEPPPPGPRPLPVAVRAFRALDGVPVDAEVIVTRGGFLITKVPLPAGRGEVQAQVGDHILVGGPGWNWRETVVSPHENRAGDPWRAIDAEPLPPAPGPDEPVDTARAANARLSGLGLLCPLTPR